MALQFFFKISVDFFCRGVLRDDASVFVDEEYGTGSCRTIAFPHTMCIV